MKIANSYNHLNAREYLIVNKPTQFQELKAAFQHLDANDYLKISCEKKKIGKVFYSQSEINEAVKRLLSASGWSERRVDYYVTGDEATTREIVRMREKTAQKQLIEDRGLTVYSSYNQIDFQKDRIAIEVQFGKYFSVAYDLHVKHTFFFLRDDIDVGIEIIPTKAMCDHMDSGVSWYENEVTNVIREGRTNPPVPILVLGIEPDMLISTNPEEYSDEALIRVLRNSDIGKYRQQLAKIEIMNDEARARTEKINRCLAQM